MEKRYFIPILIFLILISGCVSFNEKESTTSIQPHNPGKAEYKYDTALRQYIYETSDCTNRNIIEQQTDLADSKDECRATCAELFNNTPDTWGYKFIPGGTLGPSVCYCNLCPEETSPTQQNVEVQPGAMCMYPKANVTFEETSYQDCHWVCLDYAKNHGWDKLATGDKWGREYLGNRTCYCYWCDYFLTI